MRSVKRTMAAGIAVTAALAGGTAAVAAGSGSTSGYSAQLTGFEETPSLATPASGSFTASYDASAKTLSYTLHYQDLPGAVQQAHIHLGQRGVAGGIAAFFCSNLAGAPAGTQKCPAAPATITGTIHASDVIGPTAQGLKPGDIAELVRAMRNDAAYANVHSSTFPMGEIRGQILVRR